MLNGVLLASSTHAHATHSSRAAAAAAGRPAFPETPTVTAQPAPTSDDLCLLPCRIASGSGHLLAAACCLLVACRSCLGHLQQVKDATAVGSKTDFQVQATAIEFYRLLSTTQQSAQLLPQQQAAPVARTAPPAASVAPPAPARCTKGNGAGLLHLGAGMAVPG